MDRVSLTYRLYREAEEHGFHALPGTVLIYRETPRFPWFHSVFDLPPGTRCEVKSVDYDPCEGEGQEWWDNHYHHVLTGLEDHGGISTTETAALFDHSEGGDQLDFLAGWVKAVVKGQQGRLADSAISGSG